MGSAFIKSARDNQPNAANVVDHFHVIKLYNEKMTILRREMQRDAETAQGQTSAQRYTLVADVHPR